MEEERTPAEVPVDRTVRPVAEAKGKTMAFRPMNTAPKDGTSVLLLIDGGEHPLSDDSPSISIGSYGVAGGPEEDPTWTFAGWCWHQDCYCRGSGTPIGWMPLPPAKPTPGSDEHLARALRSGE